MDDLNTLAEAMEKYGQDAVNAFITYFGEWNEQKFEEAYQGDYSNSFNPELSYSEQLFDEIYAHEIPDNLKIYIDYEKFARDLFICDYTSYKGHIFFCHF